MPDECSAPIAITEVMRRATILCGDKDRAGTWLRTPLPGFGDTPERLIADGRGALVLLDLDRQEAGVYC